MAKVFLGFNQTHIEVYVDEHQFCDDWSELTLEEADEIEQEMIQAAIDTAECDGHNLTEMYDAQVGDF